MVDRGSMSVEEIYRRLEAVISGFPGSAEGSPDQVFRRAQGLLGGLSAELTSRFIDYAFGRLLEAIGGSREEQNGGGGGGLSVTEIVRCIELRRQSDGFCVVCQDNLGREDDRTVRIVTCGHEFHCKCITRWLLRKNVCPLCRAKVNDAPN